MINFIGRLLNFSKEYAWRIKLSFLFSFMDSMLFNVPVFVAFSVFIRAIEGTLKLTDAIFYGLAILFSLVIRCIFRRIFVTLESGTGYKICERERLAIGNILKRFPMGYFSDGNIGNITSAVTVDLLFVEEHGMAALDKVINGYCSILIGCLFLIFIDWPLALSAAAITIIAMVVLEWVQKVGSEQSAIRQQQSAELTDAVLEYVKGISVIKAFNMTRDKAKRIKDTIKDTCNHSIMYEEKFMLPNFAYQLCFSVGVAIMIFLIEFRYIHANIEFPVAMMLVIYAFYLFRPVQALGSLTSQIRIMEACLNRYEMLKEIDILEESGDDVQIQQFDIEFQNVSFSYENDDVIHDISFKVPEKSMAALVGYSGSGKSTIANLIVRFWDVQHGSVMIGGTDIKEISCESLLKNIAMVFQKVYLFQDTIKNNISFGKPNASMDEIISSAKAACCHDFIMALPEGYNTVVCEGGSSLSGGEKQRISIARAILKDASIILMDEATASIDPENEHLIQNALASLTQGKTVITIAHRLNTIRNADQILVMDDGRLVQKGTHDELIIQDGVYRQFVSIREEAESWGIS